jgi:hypothetical protein
MGFFTPRILVPLHVAAMVALGPFRRCEFIISGRLYIIVLDHARPRSIVSRQNYACRFFAVAGQAPSPVAQCFGIAVSAPDVTSFA